MMSQNHVISSLKILLIAISLKIFYISRNNVNIAWHNVKREHDIWEFRDCIRSVSVKRDSENRQKLAFLLTSANEIQCVLVFKPTFYEREIIFLNFSQVLAIHLHLKQNHRDFSYGRHENYWFFLAIFGKTYGGLYICHFLWLQHVSVKSKVKTVGGFLHPPPPKMISKKFNQKWVKCRMKAIISQVILQTSLLIV